MNLRGVSASYTIVDEVDSWAPPKQIDTFTPSAQIPYHCAIPSGYSFAEKVEMVEWCCETFGPPGYRVESMHTVWDYQKNPGLKTAPNARYFYSDAEYFFWFSEEKHMMLFILRWS